MGPIKQDASRAVPELRTNISLLSQIKSNFLFNAFYRLFDVVHADTPELEEQALRLRYQVFCLEHNGYEDPSLHPDGMERDVYDKFSQHALLIYKPTGQPMGTTRVIRHNPDSIAESFPMQKLCNSRYLQDETYVKNSCEFSRFCVSRGST